MLWWLCYHPQQAPCAGVGSPSRDETSGYDLQTGAGPGAQQGVCGCTQAFTGVCLRAGPQGMALTEHILRSQSPETTALKPDSYKKTCKLGDTDLSGFLFVLEG